MAEIDRLPARFVRKVRVTESGCWIWTGSRSASGYGQIKVDGKTLVAHRFAYELLVGPIPAGLQADHLCRVRECANPDHIEPVTQRENILRGISPSALAAATDQCPAGHAYVAVRPGSNQRSRRKCKECRRNTARARNHVRAAAARAVGLCQRDYYATFGYDLDVARSLISGDAA